MTQRQIFEEVNSRPKVNLAAATASFLNEDSRIKLMVWLITLFLVTILTVLIGGMTRLTDSGLSITEWKPVTGIIPPIDVSEWNSELQKYRQTPEFNIQNFNMTMSEFKVIYWWEWGHRQMGRLVGLVWLLGFVWFAIRRELIGRRRNRMLAIGGLIVVQGAIGWWMVSSGLVGNALDVAPYRLAIHLSMAVAIAGLVFWEILLLCRKQHDLLQSRRARVVNVEQVAGWLIGLVALQLLSGAIVAGNDAGTSFPTWPLMNGEFIPANSFNAKPWISNFISNSSLVHFNHRMLGYLVLLVTVGFWWLGQKSGIKSVKIALNWALAICLLQVVLGILTTLHAAVPSVAIIHQFGALLLIHVTLWSRFEARYPQLIKR